MVDFENCCRFYVVAAREGVCHVSDTETEARMEMRQALFDGFSDVKLVKFKKVRKNLFELITE